MNNPNQTQAELQEELADIQAEIAERERALDKAAGLVSWLENCNDPCLRLPAAQAELQEAELFLVETKRELAQVAAKLAATEAGATQAAAIAAELNRDAAGTESTTWAILAAAAQAWQAAQDEHARKLNQAAELRAQAKLAADPQHQADLEHARRAGRDRDRVLAAQAAAQAERDRACQAAMAAAAGDLQAITADIKAAEAAQAAELQAWLDELRDPSNPNRLDAFQSDL